LILRNIRKTENRVRKWHRWLATLFGVFLLWISATGVLSQVGSLVNQGGFETAARAAAAKAAATAATPPGFTCPETMSCRPKPKPGGWNVSLLHHLHSGEQFGPAGVIVSILSGLSLFFFAFSGVWMYVQMLRGRMVRVEAGKTVRGGKMFW
jgi:uncharacterized iron-regulated membrane protein